MTKRKKCKHGFVEWLAEGDKRLICRKCNRLFAVDNGRLIQLDEWLEDD